MTNMNKTRPIILCGDFETLAGGTTYAKKYNDTFIYAFHVCRVPLYLRFGRTTTKCPWHPLKWAPTKSHPSMWNKKPNYLDKDFGTWDDFVDYLLNKMALGPNQLVYLYFHNGQKFDFVFIQRWLINNNWYRALSNQETKECQTKKMNFYVWNTATGWNSGTLYFWNEKSKGYIIVELRDTIKIQLGSIKEIGDDLFGEKGAYRDQWLSNPWLNKFDLQKKPLDTFYVDDLIDGETVICKDGYQFNIHRPDNWPKMIKERVGSDVYIMVGMLYYYILNQVINPRDYSSDIAMTQGQVAIQSYFRNDVLKTWPHQHVKDDKEVWTNFYHCDWETRFNEYLLLSGEWDILGISDTTGPKIARGGFTNGLDEVKGKIIKAGKFLSFDVNSEYPFIALNPVPYGPGNDDKNWDEIMADDKLWGVIWIKAAHVKQLITNVPAMLLAKFSENDEDDAQIYKYELDNFFGCFTKQEFKVFFNDNYFIWDGVEVVNLLYWKTEPLLKNFMETNYQAKQQASKEHNKTKKLSAKLKLNSITGKFSQKLLKVQKLNPETFTYQHLLKELDNIKGLDEDMKTTLKESDFRYDKALSRKQNLQLLVINEVAFANTGIYSFITGGGRAWIQTNMLQLGLKYGINLKVLYGDTDSMKIWVKDQQTYDQVLSDLKDEGLLDDDKLGMFKEEFGDKVKCFKYICPKKYLAGDKDLNIIESKSALSGLKWDNVKAKFPNPTLDDIYVGAKFYTLKPSTVKHGVLLNETEYEIKE